MWRKIQQHLFLCINGSTKIGQRQPRIWDDRRVVPLRGCHRLYSTTATTLLHFIYDSSCPYQTLQIPVGSDYETTRRAFLHMVKIHHPDNGGKTHDFIRIRSAFEAIADGKPFVGKTNHHHHHGHHETHHNDDDGEFYYHHHHDEENGTHHRTTTTTVEDFLELELTEQTRQEIIQVYRRNWSNHSGVHYMHDKGGLWEMARQLSERDARGIDPPIPSKIEAGNATLGRRKRRLR